jgi:hypothetical protein
MVMLISARSLTSMDPIFTISRKPERCCRLSHPWTLSYR